MSNREKLQTQIDEIANLKRQHHGNAEFSGRHAKTLRLLSTIFGGENSLQYKDFKSIYFSPRVISYDTDRETPYQEGLSKAKVILTSMLEEIEDQATLQQSMVPNNLINLETIFNKFHLVARQLRARHDNRETLDIGDEYDVQDLLHALLRQYFDDIRPEEWSPSYAGSSKRTDFLLKNEKIIIEVKKTRSGLKDKEIGEQLIIDIANYRHHSDCEELICFVYDPDGYIKNPRGLENDLAKTGDVKVKIFIRPII